MAQPRYNRFQQFDFSAEEEIVASTFHELQLMWLQNLRADAAEQKLNLKFDPQNPQTFTQDEASLEGQIKILSHIMEVSAHNQEKLQAAAALKSQPQG
jgi:hypothetical protein